MIIRMALLFFLGISTAFAQVTLEAPATAKAGGQIMVAVTGKITPRDFVTIVPKGSREGAYEAYQYTSKPGAVKLAVPPIAEGLAGGDAVSVMPGTYSVRLKGQKVAPQPVSVRPKEDSTVKF
jgi:Ca-activated chloride channel homolog